MNNVITFKRRVGPLEYWMNWTIFWLIVVLISIVVSCIISSSNNNIEIIFLTGWWVLSAFAQKVVHSYKMEVVNGQKSTLHELGKC